MRGVPGEQDPADAPPVSDQRAERIGGGPDQVRVLRVEVIPYPPPDPVRLPLRLEGPVAVEHEAEPVMAGTERDDRDRLPGIADLHCRGQDHLAVQPEIADWPRLEEPVVELADAECLAGEAVAAIAGHD